MQKLWIATATLLAVTSASAAFAANSAEPKAPHQSYSIPGKDGSGDANAGDDNHQDNAGGPPPRHPMRINNNMRAAPMKPGEGGGPPGGGMGGHPGKPPGAMGIGPKPEDPAHPGGMHALGPKPDDPSSMPGEGKGPGPNHTGKPGGPPAGMKLGNGVMRIGPKPEDPSHGGLGAAMHKESPAAGASSNSSNSDGHNTKDHTKGKPIPKDNQEGK